MVSLNHIGISVANLLNSIAFYETAFGMTVISNTTFASAKYDGKYGAILRLNDAAGEVAILEGSGFRLELFQFDRPASKRTDGERPVCDHGITHFCLQVTDIGAAYSRLLKVGATFHCPPQRVGHNAATYGRDPDGNVFELLEVFA
jgi:catechol 2,3-dioxygenase-like lactoylglutathione lyase family enzyme